MTPSTDQFPAEAAEFLAPADYVDSTSSAVVEFVADALKDVEKGASDTEKAIRLFDAVRDGIRYDPYTIPLTGEGYRASSVAQSESAFCVPKAILLTACLRAVGIPAALGFADVRNHLNTPKLSELMETDLFIYHGYVQLWIEGGSYKVTPAFNMKLCERFGVKPLVFDGRSDALFHEFDQREERHMEYVNDRGLFKDIPIDLFLKEFKETYPKLLAFNRDRAVPAGAASIDDTFAAS